MACQDEHLGDSRFWSFELSIGTDDRLLWRIHPVDAIWKKERRDLEKLGLAVDGTLEIKVPKSVQVISSNATSSPVFELEAYSWKIGGVGQRPGLKLEFR